MTEKELNILSTLANLRFMSTSQIHRIHGYGGKHGDIVTRRKLRELEANGYLKAWQPSKYSQKIFYLSKKGANEVKHFYGFDNVPVFKKNDKTEHQVMVTEIYVALRMIDKAKLKRFILNVEVGTMIADAYMQLEMNQMIDANGTMKLVKQSKCFYLEADRGTESIAYIRDEKLEGYKKGYYGHMKKYGSFPDVVFITTSDTRKRSLLNLTNQFPFKIRVFTFDEFQSNPLTIM